MYSHPQQRADHDVQKLRKDAGKWLKSLREKQGLSQRQLAEKVAIDYYTFISQLEAGRGRIPPNRYVQWAEALGLTPADFVRELMRYYDPVTHAILFGTADDDDGAAIASTLPPTLPQDNASQD